MPSAVRISSDDALARLTAAGAVRAASALDEVRPGEDESFLPLGEAVATLLPYGALRRGSVIRVERSMSALLALLAAASGAGSWTALVGLPSIGVLAARDAGLDTDRLALIPAPGDAWPEVTAALLDAVDLVVLASPPHLSPADTRRLDARVRERKSILFAYGSWPSAHVEITAGDRRWHGIGQGHGRLTGYEIDLHARGRGAAVRPRRARLDIGTPPARPGTPFSFEDARSTRKYPVVRRGETLAAREVVR